MCLFKYNKDKKRFLYMHPIALMIFFDMVNFCHVHGQNFVVTSTYSTLKEDIKLKRKSNTHRTGRSFDVSNNQWPDWFNDKFIHHFTLKYADVAAVNKQGDNILIVDHVGTARHLHVQIHSKYSLPERSFTAWSHLNSYLKNFQI